MYHGQINIRYARSLYLLAEEKNLLDEIILDMDKVLHWFEEIDDLKTLLEHPVIKASKKTELIDRLFKDQVNKYTLSFLQLTIKKKRENHIKNMCIDFKDLYKKGKGLRTTILTTAIELTRTQETNIKRSIEKHFNSDIDLRTKVNDSIIGGMIIQVDDQQLDLSISRQIKQLKDQLRDIDFNKK